MVTAAPLEGSGGAAAPPPGSIRQPVVGLHREREVLTVALATGRHVVIEGPPGTGKSTLLRDIARGLGQRLVFVEGNAELTPARLTGQYDPAQVLAQGYVPDSFTDGPLLTAMRDGALLYLEEFNRIPEETLNVLITVLAEGEIAVPRLGTVAAADGFRLIGAMNPFDAVGTARVSQAVADRICRVVLGYQDEAAERRITTAATGEDGPVTTFAVALTRATRTHPDVRMGASVRGSIDLVLLLTGLARLRGEPGPTTSTSRDAAYAALSGRIAIADGCDRTPESVIDELLATLRPEDGEDSDEPPGGGERDPGKADGPPPPPAAGPPARDSSRSSLRRDRREGRQSGNSRRTVSRTELATRHASFGEVSPQTGQLDEDALAHLLAENPDAAATLLADLATATDRDLATAARRLAARVFVRYAAAGTRVSRGTRRLGVGTVRDGDLDLDRTLARLSGSWPPAETDLITRSWRAHQRSLCLVIDTSGSMSGLGVAIAAVAAASAVLADGGRLDPSIVAFGSRPTVLRAAGTPRVPEDLVGDLIALRGHGLTDLAAALRTAAAQLARTPAHERVAVLLSDCQHTTGADPATALAGIDRLHILCPLATPEAHRTAAALARPTGGLSHPVTALAEVAPALTRLLSRAH